MSRVQAHAITVLALSVTLAEADAAWERMRHDLQLDLPEVEIWDGTEDEDEGPVEWVMPADFSPANAMDVLRQLGGGGTMGLSDLSGGPPDD